MVGQLVPVDLYHAQRTDQRIAARPTAAAQKTTSPATPKGLHPLTAAVAGGSASMRRSRARSECPPHTILFHNFVAK